MSLIRSHELRLLFCPLAALLIISLLFFGCAPAVSEESVPGNAPQPAPAAAGAHSDLPPAPPDGASGGTPPAPPEGLPGSTNVGVTAEISAKHAALSDRDMRGEWDAASAVHIALSGASATVDGTGAAFQDGKLTISKAGTYVLSGALSGCVVISAKKDDKVQLVLNGADVACSIGPALTVSKADKTFVTIAAGTINTLSDAAVYSDQDDDGEPDACLFSKGDLTINGAGTLTVTGAYRHGIVSKDALIIHDTKLSVTANGDGLKSNDGTTVAGNGALTVTAARDALETEGDCIIETGAHVLNAGNDGIHADGGVYINGGTVDVQSSTEGLEGLAVCISGGDVSVVASDDGINASGGDDKSGVVPGAIIAMLGGRLFVTASGDGLDSNGDLLLAGGETNISIDMHTGNSPLDYNGGCELTGGALAATGGVEMLQTVLSEDSLPILCTVLESEQAANAAITLTDGKGNPLLTFSPANSWQSAILRAPSMAVGDTVTLAVDGAPLYSVTLENGWNPYGKAPNIGGGMPGQPPQA